MAEVLLIVVILTALFFDFTNGFHDTANAVAELFRSGQDPISIIRWKDIHEQLEDGIDAFQRAADVLEAILVKNR